MKMGGKDSNLLRIFRRKQLTQAGELRSIDRDFSGIIDATVRNLSALRYCEIFEIL